MPAPIYDEVTITNSALLKVGAQEISSFDDDTRASNVAAALFYLKRDEVMRAAPWRFALTQRQFQVPSGTAPSFRYLAAYDIPSDILRVWEVDVPEWTEVGSQILCDKTDGIDTLCVYRNENAQSWDAQFAEALAWKLAIEFALSLVQSSTIKDEMQKGYDDAIKLARSTNAIIGSSKQLIASFWLDARKYGFNRTFPVVAGPLEPYGP